MAALASFEKRQSATRSQRPSHRSSSLAVPDSGPRTGTGLLINSPSGEFPSDVRPSMDTIGAIGANNAHGRTNGMTRRVYEGEDSINLARSGLMGRDGEDPFDDRRSIATDQLSFGSTNVIPIAFVPPSGSEEHQDKMTAGEKLDAARRALGPGFQGVGPPSRPARSPDLDLRLRPAMPGHPQPPSSFAHPELVETLGPSGNVMGSGERDVNSSRASVLTTRTGVSAVPSFMSGSSAFESEAPQIVTRRQVQTGVVQQAAVVDLSGNPSSLGRNLTAVDPRQGWGGGDKSPGGLSARSAASASSDPFSDTRADRASGMTFGKMLDSSMDGHESGENDGPGEAYGLGLGQASHDLRFSMGSLAMGGNAGRDSMGSSMTGWSVGPVQVSQAQRVNLTTPQKPTGRPLDQRESVMSGRSDADSFLNAIIPPSMGFNQQNHLPSPNQKMPTGMSNNTLNQSPSKFGDSNGARQTMMSTNSEGLGGFDFTFGDGDDPHREHPPVPGPPRRRLA
jgi:hypothetical protein